MCTLICVWRGIAVDFRLILQGENMEHVADVSAVENSQLALADGVVSRHEFEFKGDTYEYFRIWIVNLLLTIFTLGIYSAWAKVRTARYFHAHTRVAGSHFEYTGNPWAILRGRAILLLLVLGLNFLPTVSRLSFYVLLVLLFLLIPYLVVAALRFRLHNTQWRGIRFGFVGAVKEAAIFYILWPVAGILSLGLLMPYVMCKQQRWVISNTRYGRHAFQADLHGSDYYSFAWRWFAIGMLLLLVGGTIGILGKMQVNPVRLVSLFFVMLLLYFWLFAYAKAQLANIFVKGTKLPPHALSSALQTHRVAWLYFTHALALLFTLGLAYPWAKIRMARYKAACTTLLAQSSLDEFAAQQVNGPGAVGDEISNYLDIDVGI